MAIRTFRHKGPAAFARTGTARRLPVPNADRVRRALAALDAAAAPNDLDLPGFWSHGLVGKRDNVYSIRICANCRLTFEWDGTDAVQVDLEDYH